MALIIDGYNLLHASGILGRGVGPGGLQRARSALLNFLAESLEPEEIAKTTIVFDAANPPHGLARIVSHRGLTVHFSSGHPSADELIEGLIQADTAPKRLVVVSSDHRIHRAARRRRARPIDSDKWFAETVRRRMSRSTRDAAAEVKPSGPLAPHEVRFWLSHFGQDAGDQTPTEEESPGNRGAAGDIFPPGYGDDLLDEAT